MTSINIVDDIFSFMCLHQCCYMVVSYYRPNNLIYIENVSSFRCQYLEHMIIQIFHTFVGVSPAVLTLPAQEIANYIVTWDAYHMMFCLCQFLNKNNALLHLGPSWCIINYHLTNLFLWWSLKISSIGAFTEACRVYM